MKNVLRDALQKIVDNPRQSSGWCQRTAVEALQADKATTRWRPISEIHEDLGSVVAIHIEDPGSVAVVHVCAHDFDIADWTHFARLPELTGEQADELIEAMEKEPGK